jgi:hypothetical protein
MSETAYERGYRVGASDAGGGGSVNSTTGAKVTRGGTGFFTQQWGPLPVWGWMAVGLLIAVGYYFWNKNQSSNSSSTTGTTGTTNDSLIPQFVNQTYTQVNPPSDGNTGGTANLINVPDVQGQSLEASQDELQAYGFLVKGFSFAPNSPKGSVRIVTNQEPRPGTMAPKGSTITLTGSTEDSSKVSSKPKKTTSSGGGGSTPKTPVKRTNGGKTITGKVKNP